MSSRSSTVCGEDCAGASALTSSSVIVTLRRWRSSSQSRRTACMTASRRSGSVSRMSSCRTTRLGTLLTAPGWTVAGADGGYGVDRSGGEGVLFDGENEFGGGAERVFAVGHQERSGVAAKAGDGEAIAGGRGDAGDDAERNAFALEQRTLLDVQLDPGVIVVRRQSARRRAARRSLPRCGQRSECGFVLVLQGVGAVRVERAGDAAGCQDSRCRSGSAPPR